MDSAASATRAFQRKRYVHIFFAALQEIHVLGKAVSEKMIKSVDMPAEMYFLLWFFTVERNEPERKNQGRRMRLTDIITEESIRIPLQKKSKRGLIKELVDLLADAGKISDREAILESVMEREKLMSTGVGKGVAIPHAKSKAVGRLLAAFGITSEDVDFQALDNKPVRLIFLLIGPEENPGLHIKALSKISRLTSHKKYRHKLINAASPEEVMRIISDGDHLFSQES